MSPTFAWSVLKNGDLAKENGVVLHLFAWTVPVVATACFSQSEPAPVTNWFELNLFESFQLVQWARPYLGVPAFVL